MPLYQKYNNVINAVFNTVWAIIPAKLNAIVDFIELKAKGGLVADAEIEALVAKQPSKFKEIKGKVAILALFGVVSQRMNLLTDISGGTSTEQFGAAFDEAVNDSAVGAIVMDIDSPGGSVYGVQELSQKIFNARGKKPIIASVNSLAASAAYWIASAADEIVVTPSGELGSIGVLAVHTEISEAEKQAGVRHTIIRAGKHKAEDTMHEPLSDDARSAIQGRVNEYYDTMTADIARNRAVSQTKVRLGFGEGRVVGANEGIELGMADRKATLEQVLHRLLKPKQKARANRAAVKLAKIR